MKFNYIAHDNQNQNQWENGDQVSCPASNGKQQWMKLTGPVTFI